MSVTEVREDDGRRLTMAEFAAATGMKPAVLRSWEERFDFPRPHRSVDGTRRYRPDQLAAVRRLLRRREDGVPLARAVEEALAGEAASTPSVFDTVVEGGPGLTVQRLSKRTLVHVSHALEDLALETAEAPLFFGAFQTEQHYLPSQLRWQHIAAHARATVVIGGYPSLVEHPGTPAPVLVPLDRRATLRTEWIVVVESPSFNGVLAAREVGDPATGAARDLEREFDAVWSVAPGTVRIAARACAQVAAAAGSVLGESLVEELAGPPLSCQDTATVASALVSRILAHADGRR